MKRGFSPGATAAIATTMLVLAIAGWSIGWLAGGQATPVSQESQAPTPAQSTPAPKSPSSSPSSSPSPTTTAISTKDAILPVRVVGKPFLEARADLMKQGLAVEIKFEEPSQRKDGVVERQSFEGQLVKREWTILLYVAGKAPKLPLPAELGKTCLAAKNDLVHDHGFHIESYPTGEKGTVYKTEPTAGTLVTWGAQVKVYCSESGAAPTGTVG